MRVIKYHRFALYALALTAMGCAAQAQNANERAIIDIPFSFEAGTAHLPLGHYNLRMTAPEVLRLGNPKANGMVLTNWDISRHDLERPRAVFHCYNHRCFLSELHFQGSERYISIPETGFEKQAKRQAEVASSKNPITMVEIALATPPK